MLKITKGVWRVVGDEVVSDIVGFVCETNFMTQSKKLHVPEKEAKANADFIAEAGTVANETGLMPHEMAELNKELLDNLKILIESIPAVQEGNFLPDLTRVKELIQKCEKRG